MAKRIGCRTALAAAGNGGEPLARHQGTYAVETAGIAKNFGKTRALDGVDLAVPAGTVYGVLGPNGAGKTTLIRILATLLRPDAGTARVVGYDVVRQAGAVRERVSLTGQFASVDDDLTGIENIVFLGRLLGFSPKQARARAEELLEAFGLADAAGRLVRTYSGGMRRRIDIAASIVVTPELIFLDEPTTGLDPRSRNQVWDIVRALVGEGTTVLLTTQYLDEADQLAGRIAIVDHGRIIAEGTPGQLKASVGAGSLHVRVHDAVDRPRAEAVLARTLALPVELEPDPAALTVRVTDTERVAAALGELGRAGIPVTSFSLGQPSLDEVFLTLTGHRADDQDDDVSKEDATLKALSADPIRSALTNGARPRRASALSTSVTFGWRAMLKIKHVPEQLLDVTMFPVMFVLMFTYLFGGAIAGSTREYLQFLLPGILVQAVVLITIYTGHTLNKEVQKGVFDRVRTLPIWQPTALIGALLGDAARYTIASTVIITLGLVLGFRPGGGFVGVVLAVALVVLFAFSLSWIWTALGLVMRTPESLMNMSMTILFPLTFISNIFVDPSTMPGWLQSFVNVNPITHLSDAVRGLMAGEADGGDIVRVLAWCAGLVATLGPLTMYLYRNKK
jgi:ABC-2 type transport system ATP-binding protein